MTLGLDPFLTGDARADALAETLADTLADGDFLIVFAFDDLPDFAAADFGLETFPDFAISSNFI